MRGLARYLTITVVLAFVGVGCASPEDQLRDELRADGISDESIDCVVGALGEASRGSKVGPSVAGGCLDDALNELFASELADLEQEFTAAFDDGLADFDSPDTGARGSGPVDLAALATQCQAGDNAACDELWLLSPFESPEERLAESCGGRSSEPRMGTCEFWLD